MKKHILLLEFYEKTGDEFIKEIDISHYDLKLINEICPPEDPGDFEYCNGYFVEEPEFNELKNIIKEIANVQYEEFDFNIITRSVNG